MCHRRSWAMPLQVLRILHMTCGLAHGCLSTSGTCNVTSVRSFRAHINCTYRSPPQYENATAKLTGLFMQERAMGRGYVSVVLCLCQHSSDTNKTTVSVKLWCAAKNEKVNWQRSICLQIVSELKSIDVWQSRLTMHCGHWPSESKFIATREGELHNAPSRPHRCLFKVTMKGLSMLVSSSPAF
jgi:hypothetical protein